MWHWWPAVVFPSAYAVHRYYRLHRPRRLPPLTPLKLPGLYGIAFGSSMLFMEQTRAYADMIMHDKRLHIIDRAGDVAAFALAKPDVREIFRSKFSVDGEQARAFKVMREEDYYSSGIVGKLAWWDRNIWSDQKSFDVWMFLILGRLADGKGYINLPREDMKICATHLANCTSPQKDQILSAMHWTMGFSVPLAMLARWSGRRALYLPMNGLQRLLLGAWMYAELSWVSRELWYLHRIRDKDAAARVIVNLFGSFDQAFEDMGFDYSEPRDSDASD